MPELTSAGLLMFCIENNDVKVFLVHPGGPFFTNKDEGWWGIPKGLINDGEELLNCARREFEEETGIKPEGDFIHLGEVKQKGGKIVHAWAFQTAGCSEIKIVCNTFNMEWPPKSGKFKSFPEVDKGGFFSISEAEVKINSAQKEFLIRLQDHLKSKDKRE
jgi:predicted NUDIX family NTP pyrophosphohydrolase